MMYVVGIVVLIFFLVSALAICMCVVVGWVDKEIERLIDIKKEGVCNERKKLFEATEEAGTHDIQ